MYRIPGCFRHKGNLHPLRFPLLPRTHQVLLRKSGYIKLDTKATLLVGAGFKEGSKHHGGNGSQPEPSLYSLIHTSKSSSTQEGPKIPRSTQRKGKPLWLGKVKRKQTIIGGDHYKFPMVERVT